MKETTYERPEIRHSPNDCPRPQLIAVPKPKEKEPWSKAGSSSPHTCESYAYTFQLLLEFASNRHKVTPSKLYLEQIDAALVTDFLAHIEATRGNGPRTRNARLRSR